MDKEELKIIVGVIIAALVALSLVIGGALYMDKVTCDSKWQEFEHSWGPIEGCRIKNNGRWVPAENYREF